MKQNSTCLCQHFTEKGGDYVYKSLSYPNEGRADILEGLGRLPQEAVSSSYPVFCVKCHVHDYLPIEALGSHGADLEFRVANLEKLRQIEGSLGRRPSRTYQNSPILCLLTLLLLCRVRVLR